VQNVPSSRAACPVGPSIERPYSEMHGVPVIKYRFVSCNGPVFARSYSVLGVQITCPEK
jgi:hypothetical protein